ncbi:unnamed protein product [Linum trigynum]|uniref:Zinc knuckle CX2CX4HX4C domain-containing protein n=1 Tax=Linum trigynum TaxID=586398 RepID=A0AAV2GPH2_9ROSI
MDIMFHRVIDIDRATIQAQAYRKFIRIFVEVDVSKSLPDGFYIRHQQKRIRVEYKYERLYSLCYFCRKVDHTKLDYKPKKNCDMNGLPYPAMEKWGHGQERVLQSSPPEQINRWMRRTPRIGSLPLLTTPQLGCSTIRRPRRPVVGHKTPTRWAHTS